MIDVFINGEARQCRSDTLSAALLEWQFDLQVSAVAVNQTFVSKSDYDQYQLKAGDQIDVLSPIAGG